MWQTVEGGGKGQNEHERIKHAPRACLTPQFPPFRTPATQATTKNGRVLSKVRPTSVIFMQSHLGEKKNIPTFSLLSSHRINLFLD